MDNKNPNDIEWSQVFGYVSNDSVQAQEPQPVEGEIRITPMGELETFHEGTWIPKY